MDRSGVTEQVTTARAVTPRGATEQGANEQVATERGVIEQGVIEQGERRAGITGRGVGGALLAAGAAAVVLRMLIESALRGWPVSASGPGASVDEVVLGLLAWLAVALCGWLALGVALTALTLLPGRLGAAFAVVAERVTPALVRRSLTMLLGVGVGTLALPVGAASGQAPTAVTVSAGGPARPDPAEAGPAEAGPGWRATSSPAVAPAERPSQGSGEGNQGSSTIVSPAFRTTGPPPAPPPGPGWRPTQPVRELGPAPTLLTPAPRTGAAAIEHVTVRRGDCLWTIVGRWLGAGATDAEIAREWPRWYAANRDLIGPDPDLIHAGQQLVPPLERARS